MQDLLTTIYYQILYIWLSDILLNYMEAYSVNVGKLLPDESFCEIKHFVFRNLALCHMD